jgi:hypothetical protein
LKANGGCAGRLDANKNRYPSIWPSYQLPTRFRVYRRQYGSYPETLVLYRCDLKVAEMIVCRKDEFIRRAVPSALPYEAWREGNDSSWNPPTTYPAIERSASEPRGDGAAASIKVARGQG